MSKVRIFSATIISFFLLLTITGCKKDPEGPNGGPGAVWAHFTEANSSITSNSINALFVDAEGVVWMGTDSGACGFRKNSWTILRDSLQYPVYSTGGVTGYAASVTSIAQSKDASLWFGMRGGGLVRFNRDSPVKVWMKYKTPDIPFNSVAGVCGEMTQRGEVWVVTKVLGAARFTPSTTEPGRGSWTSYNQDNSILPNNLWSTTVNLVDNRFWFGSQDAGAFSYDGQSDWRSYPLPPSQQYAIVSAAFDLEGYAWFGKIDSGVSVLRTRTGEWVNHHTFYSTGGRIPSGPISAVATNMGRIRWFGTRNGLVQLNDTTWRTFNHANTPELPDDAITALTYDRQGNLWIGTARSGVLAYNPKGTNFY